MSDNSYEMDEEIEKIIDKKVQEKMKEERKKIEDELRSKVEEEKIDEDNYDEMSRRDFLKKVGLGTAGLSAAALVPSASAFNIRTSNPLKYFNSSTSTDPNFSVQTDGSLDAKSINTYSANISNKISGNITSRDNGLTQIDTNTYKGLTEPSNPQKGDQWIDTNQNEYKIWTGSNWSILGTLSKVSQIPDSEDLYARYDATEITASDGEDISKWPDETGNGRDLSAGNPPSYISSWTNNLPALRFKEENFEYLVTNWNNLSQPLSIFIVFQQVSISNWTYLYDGYNSDTVALENNDSGEYRIHGGSNVNKGSTDTSNHIAGVIYDGSSTDFRIDGSNVFTDGSAGNDSLDGLTVGSAGNGDKNPSDLNVGEILVYKNDKTGITSEIESYLNEKWAVF